MVKRKTKAPEPEPQIEAPPPSNTPHDLEDHWADVAPGKRIPRMPRKDLAEFVMAFCDGKVYTSVHLHPNEVGNLIQMVFLPLAMGALANVPKSSVNDIGLVWEYIDRAGPRSINGHPMFFSCRLMHKLDWEIAIKAIRREEERRKESTETILDEELGPAPPEEPEEPKETEELYEDPD